MVWAELLGLTSILLTVGVFFLNVALAIAVTWDAMRLRRQLQRVVVLPPWLWGFTTLFTGLPGAAFYWVANRSTFRRD